MSNINNIKSDNIHSFLSLLSGNILAYYPDINFENCISELNTTHEGLYILNEDFGDRNIAYCVNFGVCNIHKFDTMQLLANNTGVKVELMLIIQKSSLYTTEYYKDLIKVIQIIANKNFYIAPKALQDYNKLMELMKKAISISPSDLIKTIEDSNNDAFINIINESGSKMKIDYQREIDEAYQLISNLAEQLSNAKNNYERLLLINGEQMKGTDSKVLELFNYYKRNKTLRQMTIQDDSNSYFIQLFTSYVKTNYTAGEATLDAYLNNPSGCLYYLSQELKDILNDALKDRNRYILLQDPMYIKITIPYTELSYNNISWKVKYYSDQYNWTNIHYTRYSCLGGFKSEMTEAIRTKNLIQLTALILQYIQTINLNDIAGRNWITQTTQLIYDKQEDKYLKLTYPKTITDATEYVHNRLKSINNIIKRTTSNIKHSKGELE